MNRRNWLTTTAAAPILAYFGVKLEPEKPAPSKEENIRASFTTVQRVDDTTIMVTFPPYAGHSIIDDEVITFHVPRSALG